MTKVKNIAILGFGFEGRALFRYLKNNPNNKITILDRNTGLKIPRGIASILGGLYLKNLGNFDLIFRSPGIPYNLPEIKRAKNKVSSLTRLFFKLQPGKIIAITGSAGKTTTAGIIYKIFKSAGKDIYLAGNMGINPLGILRNLTRDSITALELSSFQLQDLHKSPDIAVIGDIYEEHLDKHKTFKEYFNAKAKMGRFQKKSDYVVFNLDNKFSRALARLSPAKKISFSLDSRKADLFVSKDSIHHKKMGKIVSLHNIKLRGRHNKKNIMAAVAVALIFKIRPRIIQRAIAGFKGAEHRLEFVREIRGVKFYNDSKATNVGSAIAGIDSFIEKKIVLSGGNNKNLNLRPLALRLAKKDIAFSILFGSARNELASHLKKTGAKNFTIKKTLNEAVKLAFKKAKTDQVVLLEPGTSSFDEFESYVERGKKFKNWVRTLK